MKQLILIVSIVLEIATLKNYNSMKTVFVGLSFLLALLGFSQSSLTVFNNGDQKFFLIMNGIKQNSVAQTNVVVSGIKNGGYTVKLIFEDGKTKDIDKKFYLESPQDVTTQVQFKKGVGKLQMVSMVAASGTAPAGSVTYRPDNTAVYSDAVTTTTTTTQTVTTESSSISSGNMNGNNGNGNGSVGIQIVTPTPVPNETPTNQGINAYVQDDKTVTLVVSGQGKTQDEAKQNALRSAIEQAFGAFISSKTEILNDSLIKDEIVSVANGNIQKYEVISEVQIPNGVFATSLRAIVSVTKLTSFVESKGGEIEFKGSLFGANLRQQRINEDAEFKAIINLCEVSNQILSKSIDYSIAADEPLKANSMRSFQPQQDDYQILFTIKLSPNVNFDNFANYFYSNIKSISMPVSEQENYRKLNKEIYYLTVNNVEKYFFRNAASVIALQNLFLKSNQYLHNYKVVSNLDTITINTCCYDYRSQLGSQNMYYGYLKPEIWHLNSGVSAYSPDGSKNDNPGYPQFNFVTTYRGEKVSSWRTYFEYLLWLRNNKILFESNDYFTQNSLFYTENGNPANSYWSQSPYVAFPGVYGTVPGTEFNMGNINLSKIDYYCKYLAIYSEEEISRITNILVEPLR